MIGETDQLTQAVQRVATVLAAMYVHQLGDADPGTKATNLSRMGFGVSEIADILGITPNTASAALYRARKGTKRRKRKAKAG